ncbi:MULTISPECIES: hypothetical protein [unclassified Methylobacterium]|jgi:hypothetical protein|uniref:hypothetical protein n=1 Tax=unclassified Methylobacterium TaxID=2615210 RepID=UPI001354FEA4|nr:hypothetical protein [Methylobacterium sp. 2A]MWV25274.1 hypothetical protein [Methylobacterium sp. 2A]
MQKEPILPINFTISSEAWKEIDSIRNLYDEGSDDKADVLSIAWGTTILNSGKSWENIVVGFYRKSERYKIEGGIQILNGCEIIFFITPKYCGIFEGQVIIFAQDKWFFLSPD